jgi:hypothetical protein
MLAAMGCGDARVGWADWNAVQLREPGGLVPPDHPLRGEVAGKCFAAVLADPRVLPLLESEHVSVDGTLIG